MGSQGGGVVFAFLPLMQKSQEEPALNSPSATICAVTLLFSHTHIFFFFFFF